MKKGVLRNFTKFTRKHLPLSLFFNKETLEHLWTTASTATVEQLSGFKFFKKCFNFNRKKRPIWTYLNWITFSTQSYLLKIFTTLLWYVESNFTYKFIGIKALQYSYPNVGRKLKFVTENGYNANIN